MNLKNGYVQNIESSQAAAEELASQLNQPGTKLVVFYAPNTYDHEVLAKEMKKHFEDAIVVGSSSGGQLIPGFGYDEGKLAGFSIAGDDFEVSATLINDIKVRAPLSKRQIQETADKIGFDQSSKGFGLLLVDGLSFSEEKILSTINSTIPHIPVIGGSSSDSWEFKATYLSFDGETTMNAAVLILIKTNKPFIYFRENIYDATEHEFKITETNGFRCISKLNNRPAAEVYAETLGCSIEELPKKFMYNPLGRVFVDGIWILTPTEVTKEGGIIVFGNVMVNTTVKILKGLDPVEVAGQTANRIMDSLSNPKFIIGFNCMMRHLQFRNEGNGKQAYDKINNVAPFVGLSTYGEQLEKIHCNQTLTLVAVGD